MEKSPTSQPHLNCSLELRTLISQNLSRFKPISKSESIATRAAVALVIVDASSPSRVRRLTYQPHSKEDAALILTMRSSGLKTHTGQWALPGGRLEADETVVGAALRELKEEVDLELKEENVLGFLDDFETRSGYVITPVVVWGGSGLSLTANPEEVGSIHRIPVREFLRPDAPILYSKPEHEHPILMMPVGQNAIAAPTGAILYQFREVAMMGKATRVAHFEQPSFAWS